MDELSKGYEKVHFVFARSMLANCLQVMQQDVVDDDVDFTLFKGLLIYHRL